MKYEDILAIIKSRKSLYPAQMQEGAHIEDSKIWQLLEAANYAPNHKKTEPWRFVVFSHEEVTRFYQTMGKIYRERTPKDQFDPKKIEKFNQKSKIVSHVIAIIMQRDELKRVPRQEEEYAVACAAQNIWLCMNSLGIIGYWGTGMAFTPEVRKFFQLSEKDECMGYFQLGVPKDDLPEINKSPKTSIETKVKWL